MAIYTLVISSTNDSIANLKQKLYNGNSNSDLNNLVDFLQAFSMGGVTGTVQITIRDTDPSVSTSGSGSVQKTYTR